MVQRKCPPEEREYELLDGFELWEEIGEVSAATQDELQENAARAVEDWGEEYGDGHAHSNFRLLLVRLETQFVLEERKTWKVAIKRTQEGRRAPLRKKCPPKKKRSG